MTTEEAKRWLQRYRSATYAIKRLELQLAEARAASDGLKAIQYSDMPKAHSASGDLSDAVVRYEKLMDRISAEHKRKAAILEEVTDVIERVPDEKLRTVLTMRYIKMCQWEEIAKAMHYDRSWVVRIHGDALLCVAKQLAQENTNGSVL